MPTNQETCATIKSFRHETFLMFWLLQGTSWGKYHLLKK